MSGFNDFAPYTKINGCFIVQNIGIPKRTIHIFNYPIPYLCERDLLSIPGVAESDIRASSLKGEIRNRLLLNQIIVICSDIDLLQFNAAQKAFLESAGIVNGLSVSPDQLTYLERKDILLNGPVDGVNTTFTIPNGEKFIVNGNQNIIVYLNGVKQYQGMSETDYTIAESGGPGTGFDTVIFTFAPTIVSGLPDLITADYYVLNP